MKSNTEQPGQRMRHDGHALVKLATVNRREFLKALGISGVVTAACQRLPERQALPYVVPPEEFVPGATTYYASTCQGCAAACGLKVAVRDGRPIKLEGLPEHPTSQGGLCAVGQAEVRGLYDAGRIRQPKLGGQDATWDAVDSHVQAGLVAARAGGAGVALVTRTLVSPTLRATIETFLEPYGGTLVEYDSPVGSGASAEAYALLDGPRAVPAVRMAAADRLVGLGADLLGAGKDPVPSTAEYAARRRARKTRNFRHIQIEGSLSLTGAAADTRHMATAAERTVISLNLLEQVAASMDGDVARRARELVANVPKLDEHIGWVQRLAKELVRHRGASIVVSDSSSVAEQLAVALLNRVLGNEGKTVELRAAAPGSDSARAFVDALGAGTFGAAFFLDCNPVEDLPGGEGIGTEIGKLALSVALTSRPTATANACNVVAASHHALERWSDASTRTGVVSLAQPTIRPLFATRDPMASLLVWGEAPQTDPRQHLMASWASLSSGSREGSFLDEWNRALARGGLLSGATFGGAAADEQAPAGDDALRTVLAAPTGSKTGDITVELIAEVGLRDGRNTFNPWLRELPDPLTRASWLGVVRVAPTRAEKLGVVDGDLLSIKVGGNEIQMPARIQPGQHPDVLGVPVGYGLVDGDSGPARNGYQLARWDADRPKTAGLAATVSKAGGRMRLPLMQTHSSAEGRPIIAQVSAPDEKVDMGHHVEPVSLWDKHSYATHWDMVIDLDACTGCSACVIACQAENNLPVVGPEEIERHHDMYWLRIDRYFEGDPQAPEVLFEPMLCAQCDNAPCETVCPVAATVHGADGLNNQAYNRCVGTRYCANNCPYKVRRFNWLDYTPKDPVERMALNPDVVVRERGIMEKCTFCVQRIQRARIDAKNLGAPADFEVQTACQQSCPAHAIRFGDGAKEASGIEHDKHDPRAFQVLADLGVQPSITYLARVRRRGEGGETQ